MSYWREVVEGSDYHLKSQEWEDLLSELEELQAGAASRDAEVAELVAALKPFGAIDLVESRLPAEFAMLILRARAALAAAKTQGYSE